MSDLAKRLSGLRSISSLSSHGSAFSRLKSQDSSEIPKGLFEAAAQLAGAAPAPSIEMAEPPEAPSEIEVQGATQILDTNFKVVVRVRPPLQREVNSGFHNTVAVDSANRVITLSEDLKSLARGLTQEANLVFSTYRFKFDHVHDPASDQPEVYSQSAKGAVLSALQGYNAAIIAYGQTGTGKTFTMEGAHEGDRRGIIPRAIEDIFMHIQSDTGSQSRYLVRASYLQIYNEVVSDLLKPEKSNLVIHEDAKRGVHVHGLSEWVVRTPDEVYTLMEQGSNARMVGATKVNEASSRSHAVFIVIVEKSTSGFSDTRSSPGGSMRPPLPGGDKPSQPVKVGKLNLVDLAGSERVHVTGATGKRLEESKKINQSLSALGNVIAALTDSRGGARGHVPYRDSKLTRILEDSLGGNCKTMLVATISASLDAFGESLSTLKFASRAKNVRNLASVNEDVDQVTLLRKYEAELRRLRGELQQRQALVVDKRHLLQVEEERRKAEADKVAAITALERASREFMREKAEKRALEARIAGMQKQVLVGGARLEDSPAVRTLLAREHQRVRGEYEERLRELERERQGAEEDKAQADRYKALLIKQRDIMSALTQRLTQRDEQIVTLQEELEAYDTNLQRLEDELDQRTAELIALRKAAVEQAASAPVRSSLQSALGAWAATQAPGTPGTPPPGSAAAADRTPTSRPSSSRQVDSRGMERTGSGHSLASHDAKEGITPRSGTPAESPHKGIGLRDSFRNIDLELQVQHQADEINRLQAALAAANPLAAELTSSPQKKSQDKEAAELRGELSHVLKERAALQVILGSKMRPLVLDLQHSMTDLLSDQIADNPQLLRQTMVLEKLINSTLAALAAGQQASGSPTIARKSPSPM